MEKISPSCWSLFITTYSPLSISSYSLSLRQTAQRRCEWPRTKGIGHAKENTLHFMRGVVFWEQKIAFSKKMGVKTTSLISVHYTFTKLSPPFIQSFSLNNDMSWHHLLNCRGRVVFLKSLQNEKAELIVVSLLSQPVR